MIIRVGRLQTNNFQVDDQYVSSVHCEIWKSDNVWHLRDLNSTNGTRVNGALITHRVINDGDRITIGQTTYRFRDGNLLQVRGPESEGSPIVQTQNRDTTLETSIRQEIPNPPPSNKSMAGDRLLRSVKKRWRTVSPVALLILLLTWISLFLLGVFQSPSETEEYRTLKARHDQVTSQISEINAKLTKISDENLLKKDFLEALLMQVQEDLNQLGADVPKLENKVSELQNVVDEVSEFK